VSCVDEADKILNLKGVLMKKHFRLTSVVVAICGLLFGGLALVYSVALADMVVLTDGAEAREVEAEVPTKFTYQGRLKREGTPFAGSCDFQFELWNEAAGGTLQGSMPLNGVVVKEGLFAAELDFGDQFRGKGRWLAMAVKCPGDAGFTNLGREEITAVPYALGLRPGSTVENLTGNGLNGIAHTTGRAGLVGLHYGSGGYGVYGSSPNGGGVVGFSTSWIGVYGETEAAASTGAAGVYGLAKGPNGMGVAGRAQQPDSIGVKGSADLSGGVGVWGESAKNTGVYGQTSEITAAAVWGRNTAGGVAGRFDGTVKITGGADLAEQFAINGEAVAPGTLLIIDADHPGQLKASHSAYDTAVIGIVSGANGVQPGLVLYQEGVLEGETDVAIAGRVYVLAEAISGAIKPGNMLTTSNVAGHAMAANDRDRAYGAVIGKALTGLDSGTGMVLVLVNLQ
jgi:hypothetical protein